jgi:predicted outer membrane repeat protein
VFLNGLSSYGGAIYISGTSDLTVESSTFSGNYASVNGGVLYGSGFSSIKITKQTKLTNNIALG